MDEIPSNSLKHILKIETFNFSKENFKLHGFLVLYSAADPLEDTFLPRLSLKYSAGLAESLHL